MFEIGIFIGLYSYCILLLGLLGFLYAPIIIIFTVIFTGIGFFYFRKVSRSNLDTRAHELIHDIKKDRLSLLLFSILSIQIIVNLIGALGPELGFDALWYHLTFPKLYLTNHAVVYIPGGLLYYSTMPKLLELLYAGGLAFGSEIFPKLIHFGFGIFSLVALYMVARKFFAKRMSLFVLVIFYANLVVGWESISGYIDLGRTFFELLSFWAFLEWIEKKEKKLFFYSALFIGFAIATKLLSLGSLVLLVLLISTVVYDRKQQVGEVAKAVFSYAGVAFITLLPWVIFSFIHTGNPVYPFFTHTYPVPIPLQLFNPFYFVSSFWSLFLFSADPLNPFFLMILPLIIIFHKKWPALLQKVFYYAAGGLVFWYITPRTGGGRFILPYLPMLSILTVVSVLSLPQKKLRQFLFCVLIIISLSSIGYRALANAKFLPVLLGRESKAKFLAKHLNFSFGDFADTDGYFAKHIKPTDTVLLYGFHNLFYIDFPFIDSSWVKSGDVFNYIAIQNGHLPERFQNWSLIYTNPLTHVTLFSAGGIPWTY